jgi:hypothetical protein
VCIAQLSRNGNILCDIPFIILCELPKITTRGYRAVTFAKCTTIMIAKLAVTSGLGSFLEWRVWFGNGMVGYGFGIALWYRVILCALCAPLWIILCDIL